MKALKEILVGMHKEFGWFIWGLVGLGFLWFFTGGPQRETAHQGQFLRPLAPVGTGEAYGNYYTGKPYNQKSVLDLPDEPEVVIKKAEEAVQNFFEQRKEAERIHSNSMIAETIYFDGVAGAKNTSPDTEYIRIVASPDVKGTIPLSGLSLKSVALGTGAIIPQAANLPLSGVTVTKTNVSLPANGRALITTGRSPLGTSFRVNICTGYLDQFQDYTPTLIKECPNPSDELRMFGPGNEQECADFVAGLPRCRAFQGPLPSTLSNSCKTFIAERLTYNGCVFNHETDSNFFKNEWRLFLDKTKEAWAAKNEIIKLIDARAKIIDAITY
jgi:hypothetical protein